MSDPPIGDGRSAVSDTSRSLALPLTSYSELAKVTTINVGKDQNRQTFVLHDQILRESSDFFNNALKSAWQGLGNGSIELPEVCPRAFSIYAKFVLTGLMFIRQPQVNGNYLTEESECHRDTNHCCTLFKLASFLQAPSFQDAILDAFIEVLIDARTLKSDNIGLSVQFIKGIYTHSDKSSPVRAFCVCVCLYGWRNYSGRYLDDYPHEFLCDLLRAAGPHIASTSGVRGIPNPVDLERSCEFHAHQHRGEPCYRAQRGFRTE